MHPEIALEDDLTDMLRQHEALARLLSADTEAGRCEMGTRLFAELVSLRDLNERRDREESGRVLEESSRQKDLLLKEVDHRIKNSLQIVSSLLQLQAKTAGAAAGQFNNAARRVKAIASLHEYLHKYDYAGTVALDQYLIGLCQGIATASNGPEGAWSLIVDANPFVISADQAAPLGLIVNELVTNAMQHAQPVGDGGSVHIALADHADGFSISVSDPGDGPASADAGPGPHHSGLGTRIIDALAGQIGATVTKGRLASGYTVTVFVPHGDAAH
jgi:two-component sensor histidine kinase